MSDTDPTHSDSPGAGSEPDEVQSADLGPSPDGFPPSPGTLDRALVVVRWLRERCDWDRRQTARTLIPHLLEEAHETVDAIRSEDTEAIRDELGDLLLNLAFQVVVAEEEGHFSADDVAATLEAKMVRRHPHLFGGQADGTWESRKAAETRPDSVLDGLPTGLPSLIRAHRIQEKAAGTGFDWEDAEGALAKVHEEMAEVEEARALDDADAVEEEMGDLLFAVVNYARLAGAPAVGALERANAKFERRFRAVEVEAARQGLELGRASLAELDAIWDAIKAEERG